MDDNTLLAIGILALSVGYILNFTAGILELIPDNFPLIGNIDEAIIAILGYKFGFERLTD